MSDQNVLISNGECYSAPGKRLDASFIPCGNGAQGHKTCCGAGDICLINGSCFGVHGTGYGSFLTYMAGCSDPDYRDPSCPQKFIDQPWVALTLCDFSGGAWAPCSQIGNPSTLQNGAFCTCTDASKTTVAFKDGTVLPSTVSLPQRTGQSIGLLDGYSPTAAPPGATPTPPSQGPGTSGPAPGSSPTTGNPAPSPSPTSGPTTPAQTGSAASSPPSLSTTGAGSNGMPSPSESGGSSLPGGGGSSPSDGSAGPALSSGTKIGIGIGVALGILLILAVVAALFMRRRKRRRASELEGGTGAAGATAAAAAAANEKKGGHPRTSNLSATPTVSEADGQALSEADGKPARPWSMRSELEGTPVVAGGAAPGDAHTGHARTSKELSPVAELPGSEAWLVPGYGTAQGGHASGR